MVSCENSYERARPFDRCVDVGAVATAAMSLWHELQDTISPVLGPSLVPWLFERTLFAARPSHSWLPDRPVSDELHMDLDALDAVLRQQTLAEAVASVSLMVIAFRQLLERTVGQDLTTRLLGGVVMPRAAEHYPAAIPDYLADS